MLVFFCVVGFFRTCDGIGYLSEENQKITFDVFLISSFVGLDVIHMSIRAAKFQQCRFRALQGKEICAEDPVCG